MQPIGLNGFCASDDIKKFVRNLIAFFPDPEGRTVEIGEVVFWVSDGVISALHIAANYLQVT